MTTRTTLRDRIAALEKRNAASSPSVSTTPSPSSTPAGNAPSRLKSVKDVASRFDEIGGAPVPRGAFGLGVPSSVGPKSTTSRELYGNRIPKPRNVSATTSPGRSSDGQRRFASAPFGAGVGAGGEGSQAGSEMGDEDWEERMSNRSGSPIGDHIDHQLHSSDSRSNSPSPNVLDVHNDDEPTHHSPPIETPIIALSTGNGLQLSTNQPVSDDPSPSAEAHQPLLPSPEIELTAPEMDVSAATGGTDVSVAHEPLPIPQEPTAQLDVVHETTKPDEEIETQPVVEDTPPQTLDIAESATEVEPLALNSTPAAASQPNVEQEPVVVEPLDTPPQEEQPMVVEVPAPAEEPPFKSDAEPIVQNDAPIHPASVEEEPIASPGPEPIAREEPITSPSVDVVAHEEPLTPVSEATPRGPSPVVEEPIASEPVYEAARHGPLHSVLENDDDNEIAQPPVVRPRGLSVHIPAAAPTYTTIIDEADKTELHPLPPLPPIPTTRTPRSANNTYRSASMYIPASPASPTMNEFAMGMGGLNPPARGSSLRRNVESPQARIERRIAVSTSGSGAGGTGFGRSGSSGWRPLPQAPESPLPIVSVLPSKIRDRRDSQDKSRPKSMAEIFKHGEWATMPDLTLEIPKTPTRLPASKLLPNPVPHNSRISTSSLTSFMEKQGTINSTKDIFDEFPDVPNHIPPSQIFTPTEESASLTLSPAAPPAVSPAAPPAVSPAAPPHSSLSPPQHEDDRYSSASVKSKGSKFRGLSKLVGSAAHSISHGVQGVQRTMSQRRRTSDASQPGSTTSRIFDDKKKHNATEEPESPLRSTWIDEEKKKSGWASIGVGRRK